MIEGYIVEGKRHLREDFEPDFFTSDTVFTSLADAVEGSRKIYEELLGFIKEDDASYYDEGEDPLEENYFVEEKHGLRYNVTAGSFSIVDVEGNFAEVFIKKVSINLGDKKLEETNSGHREEPTEE